MGAEQQSRAEQSRAEQSSSGTGSDGARSGGGRHGGAPTATQQHSSSSPVDTRRGRVRAGCTLTGKPHTDRSAAARRDGRGRAHATAGSNRTSRTTRTPVAAAPSCAPAQQQQQKKKKKQKQKRCRGGAVRGAPAEARPTPASNEQEEGGPTSAAALLPADPPAVRRGQTWRLPWQEALLEPLSRCPPALAAPCPHAPRPDAGAARRGCSAGQRPIGQKTLRHCGFPGDLSPQY